MKSKTDKKASTKDSRITIKLDKHLWEIISEQIELHPEWGIRSVSDFVRRAIDTELGNRNKTVERKTIQIDLLTRGSQEGSRDRDP